MEFAATERGAFTLLLLVLWSLGTRTLLSRNVMTQSIIIRFASSNLVKLFFVKRLESIIYDCAISIVIDYKLKQ